MPTAITSLTAASDSSITAVVNHAAANTSPSAIGAAANITVPVLMFAGSEDCVTPPSQHQQPMYDSVASDCKTLVTITGGGHCYFANYNLLCTIGENSCAPNLTITREEQQQTVLTFMVPWLTEARGLSTGFDEWSWSPRNKEDLQILTFDHYIISSTQYSTLVVTHPPPCSPAIFPSICSYTLEPGRFSY